MILGLDGHQPGDKLSAGLAESAIDGCVLTLRYRRPQNLSETALQLASHYPGRALMVDPCSYYITCLPQGLGQYNNYPFAIAGLNRRGLRDVVLRDYAVQCLDFQSQLRVTSLVGPGIPLDTFDDFRSELSLRTYAATHAVQQESESLRSLPLLHSLTFRESALASIESVSEYLDLLTQVPGDGFYLTVSRDVDSDPQWGRPDRQERLVRLLYLIYALSLNGYRVVYSYSDFVGLLALAAGATDVAAGWFSTTRQLYCGRLGQTEGRRGQPRPSYASRPLLAWLVLSSDVAALMAGGFTDDVIDNVGYDQRVKSEGTGTEWRRKTEVVHFWHVLSALGAEISGPATVNGRVEALHSLIVRAVAIHASISTRVRIEKKPSHLRIWLQALEQFQAAIAEEE